MNIRQAAETEAQLLSALAMRAKAHWGYSAEVLEGWRAELAVSPQGIRVRPTFVAMVGFEVAGFYSLSPLGRSWELDHLWVLPRFMHLGIRSALVHNWRSMRAQADSAFESCASHRRAQARQARQLDMIFRERSGKCPLA